MNLIKQLGGYEELKNHRDYLIDFGNEFNRPNKYEVSKINIALLEYRRHHNIFEVGDLVVEIAESPETSILKVIYMSDCLMVCENDRLNASYGVLNKKSSFYVRHATDGEIEAGHRL